MSAPYRLETLGPGHDRKAFSCGVVPLDRYFRELATQDVRRLLTNCYVAVDRESGLVAGYYTFAAASIATADLPPEHTRRLPPYRVLPAGLIGRLAVDRRFAGRGIGSGMLADAARRALRSEGAMFTLIVRAKDEGAAAFYRHYGFSPLQRDSLTLFLPLADWRKLFEE